jgi:hypothetical protein
MPVYTMSEIASWDQKGDDVRKGVSFITVVSYLFALPFTYTPL